MTLSEELQWRGFIQESTFQDVARLNDKTWTFYQGFDASADSQTVGNLAGMMFSKTFLRHGHKGILLAGGATSLIGDPGGKDKERELQDEETIAKNVENARQQIEKVLFGHDVTLVNNIDWTKDMDVLTFLRDIGKHFSMTPLVQRDYIAQRLGEGGSGISYTEFSYTLLQGMDYLHLYDTYKCELQLGGSDQWGNCLSGVELVRKARGAEVHAITQPLVINKATGRKFGKSEEGAVWLDAKKTTPTQFYQFWLNADDEGVADYLKIYTELEKPEIEAIMKEHQVEPQKRYAQLRLAHEVTNIVHGSEERDLAEDVTYYITGRQDIAEASETQLNVIRDELPSATVAAGAKVVDALVMSGLADSNSDARRLLEGGAVYVNDEPVNSETLDDSHFRGGRLLLRKGKTRKNTALIERA